MAPEEDEGVLPLLELLLLGHVPTFQDSHRHASTALDIVLTHPVCDQQDNGALECQHCPPADELTPGPLFFSFSS